MNYEEVKRWCLSQIGPDECLSLEQRQRAKAILVAIEAASATPWLSDAAEALGEVRPEDGAPLVAQIPDSRDDLRPVERERDDWKANSESWRMAYKAWQDWAKDLLDEFGRQPLHGSHGDGPAREVIAQLVSMAPGVPRCLECGCFSTVHEVDDEELRGCTDCACKQFEAPMGEEAYDEFELAAEHPHHADDRRTLVVRGGYSRDEVYIGICRSKDDQPDELIAVNGHELKRALRSMVIGEPRRKRGQRT